MRVQAAEIGTDVGAMVVDSDAGPVLLVDPRLSRRKQMEAIAAVLTDAEFMEVCSPYPQLTLAMGAEQPALSG